MFTLCSAYGTILVYLSVALGSYTTITKIFFEIRLTLGLTGLFVVASSAFASLGIFGYFEVESNLIVAEVVPFLLLAIGADNIFIFVLEYKRMENSEKSKDKSVEELVSKVLGNSAMSMLLCSSAEIVLFLYGGLTVNMPAVRVYALNAALAVFFNFVLQMTAFIAILTLDLKRIRAGRMDVFCCLVGENFGNTENNSPENKDQDNKILENKLPENKTSKKIIPENIIQKSPKKLWIDTFFGEFWYQFITNRFMKPVIIISFLTMTCASIFITFNFTRTGLDQDITVPDDSYVKTFFEFEEKYLLVGAPLYFVISGKLDYSNKTIYNSLCTTHSVSKPKKNAQ